MSNVATAIRDEINRLAKRAIKAETKVLRRASAQYRRDIARSKRELAAAQRKLALLESITRKNRERVVENGEATNGKRFSPKWLQSDTVFLKLRVISEYVRHVYALIAYFAANPSVV